MKKAIQNIVFSGVNITLLAVIPFLIKAPSANAQSTQSAVVIDPPSSDMSRVEKLTVENWL